MYIITPSDFILLFGHRGFIYLKKITSEMILVKSIHFLRSSNSQMSNSATCVFKQIFENSRALPVVRTDLKENENQ